MPDRHRGHRGGRFRRPARRRAAGAGASALVVAAALAGCASPATPASPIRIASAYVLQANGIRSIEGYLVIQNNGPADQLTAVTSSAGGSAELFDSVGNGGLRSVSVLAIPAHRTIKLDPAGPHFVISSPGKVRQGTYITLTLVFAHAGRIRVSAQVTNPQYGNESYFGP